MDYLSLTIEFQAEGERTVVCAALRDAYRKVLDENDDLPDEVKSHCQARCQDLDELFRYSQFLLAAQAHDFHHDPGNA